MKLPQITKNIQGTLEDYPDICLAILFGSAAKDRLTPRSDIDITVAANRPLSFKQRENLLVDLSGRVSQEIDLIDLHTISGLILSQALCHGIIIKTSTPLLAALLKKRWYNQADMMPYTEMILKHRSRRFANG